MISILPAAPLPAPPDAATELAKMLNISTTAAATLLATLPAQLQPPPPDALLLSAAEVARMLSISIRHVWRLRDSGELPAPVKLGKLIRWRREAVMRFLDEATETRRR